MPNYTISRSDKIEILIIVLVILVIFGVFVKSASSQTTHPDVQLIPTGGKVPMCCVTPGDLDLMEMCYERVDTATPVPLGCTPATQPDTKVCMDLDLVFTPGSDAILKCFVKDLQGRAGLNSVNSGIVDFTLPGRPRVVPITSTSGLEILERERERIAQYKHLELTIEE